MTPWLEIWMFCNQSITLHEAFERNSAQQKWEVHKCPSNTKINTIQSNTLRWWRVNKRTNVSPYWKASSTDMNSLHNPTGLQLHDNLTEDGRPPLKLFPFVKRENVASLLSLSTVLNACVELERALPPPFWTSVVCSLGSVWCSECSEELWCRGSSSGSPESSTIRQ